MKRPILTHVGDGASWYDRIYKRTKQAGKVREEEVVPEYAEGASPGEQKREEPQGGHRWPAIREIATFYNRVNGEWTIPAVLGGKKSWYGLGHLNTKKVPRLGGMDAFPAVKKRGTNDGGIVDREGG